MKRTKLTDQQKELASVSFEFPDAEIVFIPAHPSVSWKYEVRCLYNGYDAVYYSDNKPTLSSARYYLKTIFDEIQLHMQR